MNIDLINLFLKVAEILILLLAIVFTLGIIWRVEKKLDISYKLFFLGICFLLVAEMADLFYLKEDLIKEFILSFLKLISVVFFLLGVLEMRRAIRSIDGELPDNESNEKTDPPIN